MPFDLIEAARALIAVDTVSAHGNLGLLGPLGDCARQVGLSLRVFDESIAGVQHANFLFERKGGASGEALLLLTHTDTVAPGPLDRWTATSPFVAKLEGDTLYGLGSADVKIDLLCKLLAMERLGEAAVRRPVFALGTFGEEIGLLGAKSFAKHGPFRPRFVVCGEPSELTLIHAHKGYLVARVTLGQAQPAPAPVRTEIFKGRAAHSSTPHLGDNAILKALTAPPPGAVSIQGGQGANSVAAECAVACAEDPGPLQAPWLPLAAAGRLMATFQALVAALVPAHDARFDPATTVTNVGFIEGREGQVTFLLDARLLPGHAPDALAASFEQQVRAEGGTVRFERENPAVYTDPAGALCQAAQRVSQRLGLDPTLKTKATNTEAAAFAGRAEAIVFGAGPSVGNAHCANEHTRVSEVLRAVDFYEGLIRELCL